MTETPASCSSLQQVLDRKPEFTNNGPLDQFFDSLQSQLISKISEDSSIPLYQEVGFSNNEDFVAYVLSKLVDLSSLTLATAENDASSARLVPISLHDMKYFDLLVNLIVIHGVYANLPPGIGIPLEQRRIDHFRDRDKKYEVPSGHSANLATLDRVCNVLFAIFTAAPLKSNTIGRLLLKGAGFSDLMTALVVLQPHGDAAHKQQYRDMFDRAEDLQETYQLFALYTLLVHSTTNLQYKELALSKLATLPIRRTNGVISLIDFIVGVREDEEIDISKYNGVSQLLVAKPKSMTSAQYFSKLFDQIYEGLTFVNKPILVSCLNNLVSEFYFKNKRIVHDFLFKRISVVLYNETLQEFTSKALNDTINVLISLSKSPSAELTNDIASFGPGNFYLTLWIYCMFLRKKQKIQPRSGAKEIDAPYYTVILSLLKGYLVINRAYGALDSIVSNLVNFDHSSWGYRIDAETQLPSVKLLPCGSDFNNDLKLSQRDTAGDLIKMQQVFLDIDLAVQLFAQLLKLLNEPEVVKRIFLSVMSRWVSSTKSQDTSKSLAAKDVQGSLLVLVDLKLMEKLDEAFKNDIIKKPRDVLIMIDELLELPEEQEDVRDATEDSDDENQDSDDDDVNDNSGNADKTSAEEDDLLQNPRATSVYLTLLKLLSTIMATTPKRDLLQCRKELTSIQTSLERQPTDPESRALVMKLANLLHGGDEHSLGMEPGECSGEFDAEQKLQQAMMNVEDTLPPIRAHGLHELRQLIEQNSPVINLKQVLELHGRLLHDKEPFVYLNAIKGLSALCEFEPTQTLQYLLEVYSGLCAESKKGTTLDDVLKVGEVLVNYVETQNEMFGGQTSRAIVATCLKNIQQHETLDARIRMSALSLLSVCVETNCLAIQNELTDIMDCAMGVLRLERSEQSESSENSSKLLRRAALHLLHSLVTCASPSFFAGPQGYSIAQLSSLLNYVKSTDPDYLVYDQAGTLQQTIQELYQPALSSVPIADLSL
ncbi:LAFA_0G21770g1_1 [Lachancea sp. 'fantastica']|nr:LAFA_0G21770g1_1 [Lachancea sp. 'fantastica']